MTPRTESPFQQPEPVRIGFGTIMLMLLTVVGAGVGLLIYYAMKVPAITSELYAWFGRAETAVDTAEARQAQVTFALFTYIAPLALGLFVYGLHSLLNHLDGRARLQQRDEEDGFRME